MRGGRGRRCDASATGPDESGGETSESHESVGVADQAAAAKAPEGRGAQPPPSPQKKGVSAICGCPQFATVTAALPQKVGVRNSRPSRGETVGIPDQALIRLGVADSGCRHRSPGWARRAPVAVPQNGGCSDGRRRGVTRTAPDGCTARSQGPHDFRAHYRIGASAVQLPDSTAGPLGTRRATTGNRATATPAWSTRFRRGAPALRRTPGVPDAGWCRPSRQP